MYNKWCYEFDVADALPNGGCTGYYAKGLNSGRTNYCAAPACVATGTCAPDAKCYKANSVPDFFC